MLFFYRMEVFNPWAINAIEELLYYCCPECEAKHQSEELFFQHAFERHPHSKEYILPFKVKSEEDHYNGYDVKFETSEFEVDELNNFHNDQISATNPKTENNEYEEANDFKDDEDWNADYQEHEHNRYEADDDEDWIPDDQEEEKELQNCDLSPKKKLRDCFQTECTFKTKTIQDLILHMQSAHETVDFLSDDCLTCKICNNKFSHMFLLYDHLGTHFGQKSYKCDVCAKELLHGRALRVHMKMVHLGGNKMKKMKKLSAQPDVLRDCFQSDCTFKTKKVKDLMVHLETAHKIVESLTCKLCNNNLPSKWCLFDHLDLHFKQKSFKCDECDKEFLYTAAVKAHKRSVHSETKYYEPKRETISCVIKECSFVAKTKKAIVIHLGKVHQVVQLKTKTCLKCNKFIGGKVVYLYYHMKMHYEDAEYICAQCGKAFNAPNKLKIHEYTVHTDKRWNCDKCGAILKNKNSLENHKASVHDKIRYHCDKCGKHFHSKYHLKQHMEKQHEGKISVVQCELCGKDFEDKYLKRHIAVVHKRTEAGIKCDQCSKTFLCKAGLRTHIRLIHNLERNHICKICKSSFQSATYLKQHIAAVHDGIRKFQCDLCEKAFSNRFGLTRHKESFHQGKRFECDKCSKSFTQKYHLKTHLEQDHR